MNVVVIRVIVKYYNIYSKITIHLLQHKLYDTMSCNTTYITIRKFISNTFIVKLQQKFLTAFKRKNLLTFVTTESLETESRILYQMPISLTRWPTGLLYIVKSFRASNLISKILLSKAKKGASGKAATKIVTKPYCNTKKYK